MFQKIFTILSLSIIYTFSFAQSLYNPTSIKEIRLTFKNNDWDKYLDSVKKAGSETRLKGTMAIDGQKFENIGVRYKGNSSYFGSRKKGNIKLPFNPSSGSPANTVGQMRSGSRPIFSVANSQARSIAPSLK